MHWRDALSECAERHEVHCTEFAEAIATQAGRDDLIQQNGPSKAVFVEYLETGLVTRSFSDLFD
jgi:hypothetical protein